MGTPSCWARHNLHNQRGSSALTSFHRSEWISAMPGWDEEDYRANQERKLPPQLGGTVLWCLDLELRTAFLTEKNALTANLNLVHRRKRKTGFSRLPWERNTSFYFIHTSSVSQITKFRKKFRNVLKSNFGIQLASKCKLLLSNGQTWLNQVGSRSVLF